MNKKIINIFLAVFYASALGIYWVRPFGSFNELARNIVYVLAPLFAVIFSMYLSFIFGASGIRARTFRLMFMGILFLFIGEVSYVYFDFIAHIKPFPSLADLFYVSSYPFILFSIISEILHVGPSLFKLNKKTIVIASMISIPTFVTFFYLGVYLVYDPAVSLINNIFSVGYGIGDLMIIIGGVFLYNLAQRAKGGKLSNFWLKVLTGFIFILCADLLFARYNSQYSATDYWFKNIMDSLWIAGYVVLASAFATFALEVKDLQRSLKKKV